MTPAGWLLMSISCGSVTGLLIFCYARLLRPKPKDPDAAGAAE